MDFLANYPHVVVPAALLDRVQWEIEGYRDCEDIPLFTRPYNVTDALFATELLRYMEYHTLHQLAHQENSPLVVALHDIKAAFCSEFLIEFSRRPLFYFLDHLLLEFAHHIPVLEPRIAVLALLIIMKIIMEYTPWNELSAEIYYDWSLGIILERVPNKDLAWRIVEVLLTDYGNLFVHDDIILYYLCKTPAPTQAARRAQDMAIRFAASRCDDDDSLTQIVRTIITTIDDSQ